MESKKCLFQFLTQTINSLIPHVNAIDNKPIQQQENVAKVNDDNKKNDKRDDFKKDDKRDDFKVMKSIQKRNYMIEGESGWDRIRLLVSEYYGGEGNPEASFITQSTYTALIVGFIIGGTLGSRKSNADFIRRHNEYIFRGQFEATKQVTDNMTLNYMKNGYKLAWRLGAFTACFSTLTTLSVAYRNDIYFTDMAASGSIVCSLWKMKLGLKAMATSGLVGSILGLILAGSAKLALKITGTTIPEYRYWRHNQYVGHLQRPITKYEPTDWDNLTKTPNDTNK